METNPPNDKQVTFLCDSPWGRSLSVLIVEDHEIVREGLHRLVTKALGDTLSSIVVNCATSLKDAEALIESNHGLPVDLILLDLELEDANPRDCLEWVKTKWAGLPIVIVTANDDWALGAELMACGIRGLISKRSSVAIVVNALRLISAGGRYFSDEVLVRAKGAHNAPQEHAKNLHSRNALDLPATIENLIERLSPREQAVLALLAEGLSNKEIAKELSLSVGTVKNYVSSVLREMGATRRSTAIRAAAQLKKQGLYLIRD